MLSFAFSEPQLANIDVDRSQSSCLEQIVSTVLEPTVPICSKKNDANCTMHFRFLSGKHQLKAKSEGGWYIRPVAGCAGHQMVRVPIYL
jgi:hypothetical protein